jgi:peptidoglycan/LPS O-acetylase OafA/YrhL
VAFTLVLVREIVDRGMHVTENEGPNPGVEAIAQTPGDDQVLPGAVAPVGTTLIKPHHFPSFDGLRAIAAVSVLLLHTAFVSGFTMRSSFGIYTSRLEIGVSVFFLISGFLLYRPFAMSHLAAKRAPNTRRFWERRLLRIVPAYWLALTLLSYVFHLVTMGPGVGEVFIHYFFLQIYFPKAVFFGIPQAWSICTEMSFYLFLPLYAAVMGLRRRVQERQMVVEMVGIVALFATSFVFRWWSTHLPVIKVVNGQFQAVCYPNCAIQAPVPALMPDWLPARLDLFSFGMLLAVLSAWWTERASEPRWLSNRWMPWFSWLGAGVAFWGASHLGVSLSPLYLTTPIQGIELQTLYGVFAFLLLLPAVFGPLDTSLIRRFLRCWPLASLGVISYGIYLWHLDLINQFMLWSGYVKGAVPYWILVGAVMGMTIVAASISYFGLEKPILKVKDHLGWWSRPAGRESAGDAEVLTQ